VTQTDLLQKKLVPGRVYRREDLEPYSTAVDRDLAGLVKTGALRKVARGLYYAPRTTAFGEAPPEDKELVRVFLKDSRFLLTSPNIYNSLGVGTTQLYNQPIVYNHKRHGVFKLGNRLYDFRMKPHFPKEATEEFLLVDLINNISSLAESREEILKKVSEKARVMDGRKLKAAIQNYGSVRTRKVFSSLLSDKPAR